MSEFLPPVVAVLTGSIGEFKAKMGEAKAEMASVQGTAKKTGAVGRLALLGLGAAAVGVGYESVKMATGFSSAMELIHTQAGAPQAEVDALRTKVLALAPAVGIGPEKLADGLYHVESAGFRGAAALDITKAAAKEAALGMSDMEGVTQALVGTMAVGLPDVKNAADAAAYLNRIVGIGDMRMGKLAQAISTGVLPSFKSAGLGMSDFGAALATLTDNVTPADEAATRLRMTVSLMAAPSGPAIKALASIGIGSSQLANDLRKPDGLLKAVEDLKTHLKDSGKTAAEQNQVIQRAFGGGRTSGAILTLLGETDRLKDKYHELGTSTSRAKDAQESWRATQKQFGQQVHQIVAQLEAWGVQLGNKLIPHIQDLISKIKDGAHFLKDHKTILEALGVAAGVLLVAGLVAATQAMIAFTVSLLTNPVFLIIAAVALLAFGIFELVKHWDAAWKVIKKIIKDVAIVIIGVFAIILAPVVLLGVAIFELVKHWKSAWGFVKKITIDVANFVVGSVERLWGKVKELFNKGKDAITGAIDKAYHGLLDIGKKFVDIGKAIIHGIVNGVKNAAGDLASAATDAAKGALNGVKSFLHIGSPSKLFADEVGAQIPAGIAQGVMAYAHMARDAVAGVLGPTPARLAAAGPPGMGGALSFGAPPLFAGAPTMRPIEVTLHSHISLDGQQVHTSTQRRTLRQERRNTTNGLSRTAAVAR